MKRAYALADHSLFGIPRHGSFCLPAEAAATFFHTLFSPANYVDHGNDLNASEFDHILVGFAVSFLFDAFSFRARARRAHSHVQSNCDINRLVDQI